MNRSASLANRIREVLLSGKWIANTNFKEQVQLVNLQQANQRVGSLNTIALLTYHINYYLAGLLQVFRGGPLDIRDKYSFDMPELKSEDDWNALVASLLHNAEAFAAAVEQMNDGQLVQPFVDVKYGTYERNIEGVIEHTYYHLGQVSMIRKLIVEG